MLKNLHLKDSLSDAQINIDAKTRSNLFSWRGQFSPQLVEILIRNYGVSGMKILDPFVGSGTVLIEGARFGVESHGCEINPAAFSLSKVYELSNITKDKRKEYLSKIDDFIKVNSPKVVDGTDQENQEFLDLLVNLYEKQKNANQKKIIQALIIGLDIGNTKLTQVNLDKAWKILKRNIIDIPYSKKMIQCYLCDARNTPFKENSIDFVITSPPYINVFNYHQNYRGSSEVLGYDILQLSVRQILIKQCFRRHLQLHMM